MLHLLLLLSLSTQTTGLCLDAPGSITVPIDTQASLAGVIFVGEVEQIFRMRFDQIVTFRNVEYFKGCGPSRVRVIGFKLNSDCGVEAPKIGTRTLVFGCEGRSQAYPIALNDVGNFTGAYVWTPLLQAILEGELMKGLQQPQCNGRFLFFDCGNLALP